jgi:AraC family transcriptional regulator
MSRTVADQFADGVCHDDPQTDLGPAAQTAGTLESLRVVGVAGEHAALKATVEIRPKSKAPFGLDPANLRSGNVHREKVVPFAVSLLKAADQALGHDPAAARRWLAEATALLLMAHALKEPVPCDVAAPPALGGLAPWQIRRVTEFIGANLARAIRIEELAAVTQLSTGHFRHAFRCSMSEPPYAYVLRRRMEHAQELMLLTDKPLSQIALDCGFTDQPHLTRLFRRIVGVTPAAWRRQRCVGPGKTNNPPTERAATLAA